MELKIIWQTLGSPLDRSLSWCAIGGARSSGKSLGSERYLVECLFALLKVREYLLDELFDTPFYTPKKSTLNSTRKISKNKKACKSLTCRLLKRDEIGDRFKSVPFAAYIMPPIAM